MHVGESACGLDCHVILRSLSQVSFGRRLRPEPWGWRLPRPWLEAGGGARVAGPRGRGLHSRWVGVRPSGESRWPWVWGGIVEAPPPSLAAPVCRSVSGDFLWYGVRLGNATRCAGAGRGGRGVAWAL